MEVYRKGPARFNSEHFCTFAEIHDMADKPGYLGKEIPLSQARLQELGLTFEQVKANIARASKLMDQYLGEFLPNYYFTFKEQDMGGEPAAFYFMEEVKPTRSLPPAADMDAFLYQCCKMYLETKNEHGGFGVDLNKIENMEFGTTISNPDPKLYLVDFYPSYFNMPPGRLQMQLSELAKIYSGPQSFPKVSSIIHNVK
jgi:hypothetical protein